MKLILLFVLFLIPCLSQADYTFQFLNNGAVSQNLDVSVPLGSVGLALCNDPELVAMSSLRRGSQDGVCNNYSGAGQIGIDLHIPLTVKLSGSESITLAVTYQKYTSGKDFQVFDLKNTRNQSMGGGTSLLGQTIIMNRGDTLNYELDIRAVVSGSLARGSYENAILILITLP